MINNLMLRRSKKLRIRSVKKKMMKNGAIIGQDFLYTDETHLTVLKTSLFFPGDGFTVYDPSGKLVFRVDSYGDTGEVVLMDPTGKCILTVRRKRPSLHQRWEGYIGEGNDGERPLFSIRRSSIIGGSSMTVHVYTDPGEEYHVDGSFASRNCTIFNSDMGTVAEIRRKVDCTTNMVLGKDVFLLSVKAGFDSAFAMGLVLVMDRIQGNDDESDDEIGYGSKVGVEPTTEDSSFSSR